MMHSRFRRIVWFFVRAVVRVYFWDVTLPHLRLRRLSERTRPQRLRRIAAGFRELAAEMGGVLIKVGQFLSARVDVLPGEITAELAGLQDEVFAEPFDGIRSVLVAEFGMPVEEKFEWFDPNPLASASIGQAHSARIRRKESEGSALADVVVKVQRPRIPEIVEADLRAVRVVGNLVYRFRTVRRHANVPRMIEEFSKTLYEEIDYLNEGRNAERFAESFRGRVDVRVPAVYWSHTTRRVLTLENVGAIKITDYGEMDRAGVDRKAVAARLVDSYLKQIFEDGFFHADPHPGNLFVDPIKDPRGFRLVFVDFGMTGQLAPTVNSSLRELLVAIGTRDARRLVRAFERLDFLLPDADRGLIERAVDRLFDQIWGKSQRELVEMRFQDVSQFTNEFGQLLYEMPFQVPEDLILLGRCIGILSGMATGLDSEFNLWQSIIPYASRIAEESKGGAAGAAFQRVATLLQVASRLPDRFNDFITFIERGKLEVRLPEMRDYIGKLVRGARKLGGAIAFGAVLLAATAFYVTGSRDLAIAFGAADIILVLWIFFGR